MMNTRKSETTRRTSVEPNSIYPPFCKKLDLPVGQYVREGDIEYPFEDIDDIGDENKIRGNWSARADHLLSAIGFIFNLGNLFRFPYYCIKSGGAAFFICYMILMLIAGVPVVFMELSLGQFPSVGCITTWKVVPLFKGIGIAMFMISCVMCIYFGIITSWSVSYFINSLKLSLPYATCNNDWNSIKCSIWNHGNLANCNFHNGTLLRNGSCLVDIEMSGTEENLTALEVTSFDVNEHVLPSAEYFHSEVLMLSDQFDKIGPVNWQLALYSLIGWTLVFLSLFKGIKSSGKVAYVMVLAPYVILFVMLTRFLSLPGSTTGLIYFFAPNWIVLTELTVWGNAAIQVFYSLLCCTGGLITLASYKKFHKNLFRDVWILCFSDMVTALGCAALSFSAIGFLCYELEVSIGNLKFNSAVEIFFIYLPEAITKLPVAPIYAILYFAMIAAIILSTLTIVVETVVSAICDEFPERLRRNHRHVLAFTCFSFYALGIPLCTAAGLYWVILLDYFTCTWTPILIAFFECMAISWIYGIDNFLDNIKWMIEFYPPPYIFWKILWKFISPFIYMALLSLAWFAYQPISYGEIKFPDLALKIGWMISIAPLISIPLAAMIKFCISKGTLVQRWMDLLCPDDDWGPALAIHRAEYYPLQIPEARRLIMPSQTLKQATNGSQNVAQNAVVDGIAKKSTGDRRLKTSVSTKYERETAI